MKIRLIGALALAVFAISAPLASATDSEFGLPVELEVTICPTTIITSETARVATVDVRVGEGALYGYERQPDDGKDASDPRLKASDDCVDLHPGPRAEVDHGDGDGGLIGT